MLVASQRSTASFGKFDGTRGVELEKKKKKLFRKRKFESSRDKKFHDGEVKKGTKVFDR